MHSPATQQAQQASDLLTLPEVEYTASRVLDLLSYGREIAALEARLPDREAALQRAVDERAKIVAAFDHDIRRLSDAVNSDRDTIERWHAAVQTARRMAPIPACVVDELKQLLSDPIGNHKRITQLTEQIRRAVYGQQERSRSTSPADRNEATRHRSQVPGCPSPGLA